jgi:hypothetical protein
MIVRHRIFEKYEDYRFSIPYKSGDVPLVDKGEKIKRGKEILRKRSSNIKDSFYLPDQIGVSISEIEKSLNCIDGEFVNEGDVLAEKVVMKGLNIKRLVSPAQGVVDLSRIDRGYLALLGEESENIVKSTFNGEVEGINPVDGINILSDSYALDILAVADSSLKEENIEKKLVGEFLVLGEGKDLLLNAQDISYEDKVVFVGKYLHPDLMHDLFEKGALFILTYSMEYEDFRRQGLPVGVVGGFGEIYSGRKIIELIASMDKKFVVVDYSESQVFFVTNDTSYKVKEDLFVKSAVGSRVISRSLANYGMLGKILSIEDNLYTTVEWETGQTSMLNIGSLEFVSF